jgi:glycosyltransferase involved in cell wall biosynthesis
MNRLVVLDVETPWVRHLFGALPTGWAADFLGARTAGLSPRAWLSRRPGLVAVPGWTRAFGLSTAIFARRVARLGAGRAIVHTMPWTAGLLRRFADVPHVYRPHDFFGMYSWDQDRVADLERELCAACRFVAPVSAAHAEDLRRLGATSVVPVANGVSPEFIDRLRLPAGPPPADLVRSGRPIVGCVGQITAGYDLDLIAGLADAVPEADFVFIGPAFDPAPDWPRRVRSAFARPNVRWLGPKPHADLPSYLQQFDVCLAPLKVTEWNHRRSLLRLFDYLATDKPVVSTALRSAIELAPHVSVGQDAAELAGRVRGVLNRPGIDVAARRAFVDAQTWPVRAKQFTDLVDEHC